MGVESVSSLRKRGPPMNKHLLSATGGPARFEPGLADRARPTPARMKAMRQAWLKANYLVAVCLAMIGWFWFLSWAVIQLYRMV
jgi:hypothetical protein